MLAPLLMVAGCSEHGKADESPKVGKAYGEAVAKLPDWNGQWLMTGGSDHSERLMFDPEHVYVPPDPAGKTGGLDFGPLSGSKDTNIPYKPEYQKKYDDIVANILAGHNPDPVGGCERPHGMPRQMAGIPLGPEIIMTPTFVLMSWHTEGAQRRIYTDGRPHPTLDKMPADYMGHSIGHWEGSTLVADTVHMLPGIFDQSGAPFSGKVHLMERIHLVNKDTLEDEMTIDDPVMLTHPWHVTRQYKRAEPRYANFNPDYCSPGTAVKFDKNGYQVVELPSEATGSNVSQ